MMKVLLVEDEFMVAKRLRRFVEQALGQELALLKQFDNLADAQDYLAEHSIDLLFLDLNLQGNDGFTLLQEQLSQSFHTIVVSANTDRAIEAFEFGVLDFVAKPFTQERVTQAVSRLAQRQTPSRCKYLSYRKMGEIKLLPVEQIHYLKAAGHYCDIVTLSDETVVHDKSLDKLLLILGEEFERIHRSYAVKITSIQSIHSEEGSKYWAQLRNGDTLPIGRTKWKSLRSKLP